VDEEAVSLSRSGRPDTEAEEMKAEKIMARIVFRGNGILSIFVKVQ
jgi:hypothetical protein